MGDICAHKTIQFVCGFFYMCKSNLQMPQKIRLRRMTGPYFLRHLETGAKNFFAPLSMPRGSAPIILEDFGMKSSSIGFADTLYA